MLRDPHILDDTLTTTERLALDEFVGRARRALGDRLARLALFGSRARGDHDEASDIDTLALVSSDARSARSALRQIAAETNLTHDTHLTVLVLDTEEWDRLRRRERRLPAEVERDAIDL